jgi:hypothetical protein
VNRWLGTGNLKVEAVLQRLDRLTEEDACVVAVQTLEVVHCLVNNIKVVIDGEYGLLVDLNRSN